MHGGWPFKLQRDHGMRITIDLGRLPDDAGRRADIDYALRVLSKHGMVEALEWDDGKASVELEHLK